MSESADNDVNTAIINMFHMFKKIDYIRRNEVEDIKRPKWNYRHQKHSI